MAEPFTYVHRVRYHETDAQRFVFNSRFLEFADVAMTEFFRHLGWSYPQLLDRGFDPSLVTTTLDFLRPARLDDVLTVAVRCPRVGSSSFVLQFDIQDDADQQVSRIRTTYVNVDPAAGRSTPIPADIADALRRHLTPDDERRPA